MMMRFSANSPELGEEPSIFSAEVEEHRPTDEPTGENEWEDESRIVRDIRAKHEAAKGSSELWRHHARRAYNYYENDQRPPEIRDDQDTLYLILNMIRNRVDTKVGILTSAKPQAAITGRGMEDEDVAAAFRDIVEYTADRSDFDSVLHDVITDMVKVGMGVLEETVDLDVEMDTQHGSYAGDCVSTVRSPLEVFLDPGNRSPNLKGKRGINYLTLEENTPEEELMMLYPQKAYRIKGVEKKIGSATDQSRVAAYGKDFDRDVHADQGDDQSQDPSDRNSAENTKKVITIWYLRRVVEHSVWELDEEGFPSGLAVGEDGEAVSVDDISDDDDRYWVEPKLSREMWTAAIAGDVLLYNHKSPYRHGDSPFVFFVGQLHHDEATPYGEIHRLMDAQDMFNKINSLVIDNAARTNNTGWAVEEGAMDEEQEQHFEENSSQPGFTLRTRPDAVAEGRIQRLQPGQLSDALYRIQGDIRVLFDELSSLYQTQRGGMPYETSGKAIIALQQAGDTALVGLQRNVERGVTDWGRKRLANIQQFYSIEKAWRITDKLKEVSHHYLTQMGWDDQGGQNTLQLWKLDDGDPSKGIPPDARMLLKDFQAAKYDIKITMGTGHERSREQKLEDAKLVFEVTGGVPSAVRHVLNEMEVPEKREMLEEMSQRDQVAQMAQQMEESGADPGMFQQINSMMSDPAMGQLLQLLLQDPQLLMQAAAESPTVMQAAQQIPLEENPQRQAA